MAEQQEHPWHRHDPLTELHAGLARIEERLQHVIDRLETHMVDEHKDFRDTLVDVKEMRSQVVALEKKLDAIHTSAHVTRWLIAAAGALVMWMLAVRAGLGEIFRADK